MSVVQVKVKSTKECYCMKKNYNDCLIVNRKDMVQHSKACLYARDVLIAHIAAQIGLFRNNLKTDML